MQSRKVRRSDRYIDYQKALRDSGRNLPSFMYNLRRVHHNADAIEKFADKNKNGSDPIELAVTECLLEAALLSNQDEQILRCTDKAANRLSGLLEKAHKFGVVSSDILRAKTLKAYQPFFGTLALTKQLPPPLVGTRVYDGLVDVGTEVADNWDAYYPEVRKQGDFLGGIGSEIATLLLLQRFAVQQVGDGSWWAAPTTVSDANLDRGGGAQNGNWDINGFTQLGESPELSYKIEVKSSRAAAQKKPRPYEDDITVVALREDALTSSRGKPWGVRSTLSLFDHERGGRFDYCPDPSGALNAMSDRLLDAIDS